MVLRTVLQSQNCPKNNIRPLHPIPSSPTVCHSVGDAVVRSYSLFRTDSDPSRQAGFVTDEVNPRSSPLEHQGQCLASTAKPIRGCLPWSLMHLDQLHAPPPRPSALPRGRCRERRSVPLPQPLRSRRELVNCMHPGIRGEAAAC